MLLLIPFLQMSLGISSYRRLKLSLLHGVSECQVMMLTNEREDHGGHVSFKRESRDEPLMEGCVFREEHVERDLKPGRL